METATEALKQQKPYEELYKVWLDWESTSKSVLFLDLAIVHRCKEGVKLIGDLEGPGVFLTPYDDYELITPVYVAQLLSRLHLDYKEISDYMLNQIEQAKPWNRRKPFLWFTKTSNFTKLPKSLLRLVAEDYL